MLLLVIPFVFAQQGLVGSTQECVLPEGTTYQKKDGTSLVSSVAEIKGSCMACPNLNEGGFAVSLRSRRYQKHAYVDGLCSRAKTTFGPLGAIQDFNNNFWTKDHELKMCCRVYMKRNSILEVPAIGGLAEQSFKRDSKKNYPAALGGDTMATSERCHFGDIKMQNGQSALGFCGPCQNSLGAHIQDDVFRNIYIARGTMQCWGQCCRIPILKGQTLIRNGRSFSYDSQAAGEVFKGESLFLTVGQKQLKQSLEEVEVDKNGEKWLPGSSKAKLSGHCGVCNLANYLDNDKEDARKMNTKGTKIQSSYCERRSQDAYSITDVNHQLSCFYQSPPDSE